MLSGSAAGSHGNDLAVLSFKLLRERGIARSGQLSLTVISRIRGSIHHFNPVENEVSKKAFASSPHGKLRVTQSYFMLRFGKVVDLNLFRYCSPDFSYLLASRGFLS